MPYKDKEKQKEYQSEWRKNNREKCNGYCKKWRLNNTEYSKEWDEKNPEKRREIDRKYKENNREELKKRRVEYYKENREIEVKKQVIRNKQKMESDPNYAVAQRLRQRVKMALKNYLVSGIILRGELINYKEIIEHLKPFPENMSAFHIDHIRPLCSFKFVNEDGSQNLEAIKEAFKPENHQWLLAEDNLKKIQEDMKLSIKLNKIKNEQ